MEYSYQFSDELQQEWEWTERYAAQPEILRYVNHVADRFDLRRDIQFDTRVTAAAFDEATSRWRDRDRRRRRASRRVPASWRPAASPSANVPRHRGPRDASRASATTPASWPHEGVDFTGKRVGVIGTGSSAIQSIPIIAEQAAAPDRVPAHAELHRARPQRAARPASYEAGSRPTTPALRARARQRRTRLRLRRSANEVRRSRRPTRSGEREFEARWEQRRPAASSAPSPTCCSTRRPTTPRPSSSATRSASIVRDPGGRRAAVAHDQSSAASACASTPATTRPSTATTSRSSTSASTPIERDHAARPSRTAAGDYELDCIVFATGFDAMTGALLRIDIRGRDGPYAAGQVGRGPAHLPRPRRPPASRTCSSSPARAARRCSPTCWRRSSSTSTGSPTASATCASTAYAASRPTRGAEDGWVAHVNEVASAHALSRVQLLVPRRQRPRQAARVHAVPRRFPDLRAEVRRGRRDGLRGLRAELSGGLCSTSRSPTSMPGSGSRCAPRSRSCTSARRHRCVRHSRQIEAMAEDRWT